MNLIEKIRNDFPILQREINGKPLVYFDNAATSQTPKQVIQSIVDYYSNYNANIHRGVHTLSQEATDAYEQARKKIQKHINAKHPHEVIFTSGTTHSINLVASGLASFLKEKDQILVLTTEHHSNIVPWQLACQKSGAELRPIPINEQGEIIWEDFEKMLTPEVKVISFQHVSNALGNIFPAEKIIKAAQKINAITVVDGAQACPHLQPDVQALGADFYAASAHKMYGPTGVGFLYAKESWQEKLPPYQGGGEMIKCVDFQKSSYADLPYKFEAGTPNICGGIAFGAAIDYMHHIGMDFIARQEKKLLHYATERMQEIPETTIYGTKNLDEKTGVISFNIKNLHAYDVGTILDKMGVEVRTGHHCAQPIMDFYQISGTVRASFAVYNTEEEIDFFINSLKKAKNMLS